MDKEEEMRQIALDLQEQLPRFEKHGRVLKMVPKDIDDDLPEVRTRAGFGIPPETSVKNLYNVGDAIVSASAGGTTGAVEFARLAVEMITKRVKPG